MQFGRRYLGLIARPTLTLVISSPNMTPPKTLPGKWTPHVRHKSARFRTTLRLEADGNAEIYTNATGGNSNRKLRTTGRWQLLDNKTLHLWGARCGCLELFIYLNVTTVRYLDSG
jgi:hypothetical protein